MIHRTSFAAAFVLLGSGLPSAVRAQTAGTALTAEQREAQAMGLEMAFACSPRRHGEATGSTSTIRREADALAGTAVHFSSIEGTFLALEEYDEALDGHCLVFGWWGGDLAPGTYAVAPLAMSAMEQEQMSGEHAFYSWGAVRTTGENMMILVESGSLTLERVEAGLVTGSFELAGFAIEGNARGAALRWAGSFSAVEGEPL
ncbi:MAG: hypothetical protein AB7T31_04170 [Gemmatimonadales bacterium]